MKAKDAMIFWDEANSGRPMAGQCRVVRVGADDRRFPYSSGAVDDYWRKLKGCEMEIALMRECSKLIKDGLAAETVMKEFSKIDEWDVLMVNEPWILDQLYHRNEDKK